MFRDANKSHRYGQFFTDFASDPPARRLKTITDPVHQNTDYSITSNYAVSCNSADIFIGDRLLSTLRPTSFSF